MTTTHEIKRQIAEEKTQIGENLNELETRAKDMVDWRARFRKDPKTMLGLAFGGGILLARLFGTRRAASSDGGTARPENGREPSGGPLDAQWKRIEAALVGAASAKAIDFLGGVIPGFQDHLKPMTESGPPESTRR